METIKIPKNTASRTIKQVRMETIRMKREYEESQQEYMSFNPGFTSKKIERQKKLYYIHDTKNKENHRLQA